VLKISAVIAAAGEGKRFGGTVRKPYVRLAGKPLLLHSAERIAAVEGVVELVVMVHPSDAAMAREEFLPALQQLLPAKVSPGASLRQETIRLALRLVNAESDLVLIHDAVRPLVRPDAVERTIRRAAETGAAILASPLKPTVKRRRPDGTIQATVARDELWGAQTPQVFGRTLILEAYDNAERNGVTATDDAQLVERLGRPVSIVEGPGDNIKVTTPEDLAVAEAILALQRRQGLG